MISAGLVALAFAAILGSRTTVDDGYGFTALWLSIAGLGFGFAVVPAMSAALGALPRDRAGSGSGLLMTVRQVGSAIGIALLGSLLAGAYSDRLDTSGLARAAADTASDSVVGAHVVAGRLGDSALAASADASYIHGMNLVLLVSGVAALITALLAAALLPNAKPSSPRPPHPREGDRRGPGRRRCPTMSTMAATAHSSTPSAEPRSGSASGRR